MGGGWGGGGGGGVELHLKQICHRFRVYRSLYKAM